MQRHPKTYSTSMLPRRLNADEYSPSGILPQSLKIKKEPILLPPIEIRGRRITNGFRTPRPPPPTPDHSNWYHRNCVRLPLEKQPAHKVKPEPSAAKTEWVTSEDFVEDLDSTPSSHWSSASLQDVFQGSSEGSNSSVTVLQQKPVEFLNCKWYRPAIVKFEDHSSSSDDTMELFFMRSVHFKKNTGKPSDSGVGSGDPAPPVPAPRRKLPTVPVKSEMHPRIPRHVRPTQLMLTTGETSTLIVGQNQDVNQSLQSSCMHKTQIQRLRGNLSPVILKPVKPDFLNVISEMWSDKDQITLDCGAMESIRSIVGTALLYNNMYHKLLQESEMSAFLLEVAQAVFEELVSLDQLIKRILEFAQRLVNADRASLFLVDYRNSELVSTVFDLKHEPNQDGDLSKKEIRMPINKGIAGHVAMSGETMNIPDAYSDLRFNKAVDEATGYRTITILCMPIKVRGKVIAVVQMVNKRDKKVFDSEDESAFQVFSTFFGLALHHAKLYDKIKRKEQKYRIALEVLSYHNTCDEEDVKAILQEKDKEGKINFNDFALNPFEVDDAEKCKGVLKMFDDLFDISKFNVTVLTRFVLTVKKNYRKVPYHNFNHGWTVANAMYVMLKHDTENRIDYKARLALFVACLCHDLDHRGYTNRFMSDIASPLAAMYSTSTLEHHHFNITVTILQQDGHNIFSQMSNEEYKDMLGAIRHCILATDLAVFFPNMKRITELVVENQQFNWKDDGHRLLCKSIMMTCADLSAAAKPFHIQLATTYDIFNEYYIQGELERMTGKTPVAMMDRSKPEEQPASQVSFLSDICLPAYNMLQILYPDTKEMYIQACKNLENWKLKVKRLESQSETEKREEDD